MNQQRTFTFPGPTGVIVVAQMQVEFAVFEWDASTESYRITFHFPSGKTVGSVGFTKGHLTEVEAFLEGRRFAK